MVDLKEEVLFEDVGLENITCNQPQVSVYATEPCKQALGPSELTRPIYCVSDLHLGDNGPRDNFAWMSNGKRYAEFISFLDFVEAHNGQLIIAGDLFELWQSNISLVITYREQLLDRLATMKTIYVLGNHDADLLHFIEHKWLAHPFFKTMCRCHMIAIAGRKFYFTHGHETDKFCSGETPGLGRITAIYTGLKEDRNGSPLREKYPTVEARTLRRLEWPINFIRRICGLPDRIQQMNRGLCQLMRDGDYDVIVSGHTHLAGKIAGWPIYNCGTWAEQTNSFVVINQVGNVGVFDWVDGISVPCQRKLFV